MSVPQQQPALGLDQGPRLGTYSTRVGRAASCQDGGRRLTGGPESLSGRGRGSVALQPH